MAAENRSPDRDRTRPGRILIVEDNLTSLNALARILRRHGFDVTEAADGASALAAASDGSRFDALLVDLALPDRDGRELCRVLRRTADPPPVVALLTGWMDHGELQDLRQWGVDHLFLKPLNIPHLLERLQAMLRGEPGGSPGDGTEG